MRGPFKMIINKKHGRKKDGFKKFIHSYSTGCLTQLSPKYYPFAQHNWGAALVHIENGKTKVDNFVIKDGKIV